MFVLCWKKACQHTSFTLCIHTVGTVLRCMWRRQVADLIKVVTVSIQSAFTMFIVDTLEVMRTVGARTSIGTFLITAALRPGYMVLTASIGAVYCRGPVTHWSQRILISDIKGEGPLAITHWVINTTRSTFKKTGFSIRTTFPESATI